MSDKMCIHTCIPPVVLKEMGTYLMATFKLNYKPLYSIVFPI